MMNLELAFIWGCKLESIRNKLVQIDEIHIGLLIHSLRYETSEKEKEEKEKYLVSLKKRVDELNKDVSFFNQFQRFFRGKHKFEKLPTIEFKKVKEIIQKHKGDYPEERGGLEKFKQELFARSDSASSLSRRHTVLQLRNIFLPLRLSMGQFAKDLRELELPFKEIKEKGDMLRNSIKKELNKAETCYSMGLVGEAVFVVGRILECQLSELLFQIKVKKNKELRNFSIKKWDFDTVLNFLFHKLKALSPGQYAKVLSVKWDRNTFGHKISNLQKTEKDARSNIQTGINIIIELEEKIRIAKKKNRTRRVV